MALIECPECGGKISDKAPACVHCGFPLSLLSEKLKKEDNPKEELDIKTETVSEKIYSLELLDYGDKKVQVALALKNTLKIKDTDALRLVTNIPCYLFKDKEEYIVESFIQKLNTFPVEYNLYLDGVLIKHKLKEDIEKLDTEIKEQSDNNMPKIKCPKCFSLISETERACPNCGFDEISSYLLELERERLSKIIDHTNGYNPIILKSFMDPNLPKCPTCQSTNINKISELSRIGSILIWGRLSPKIYRQWHCDNCGNEW